MKLDPAVIKLWLFVAFFLPLTLSLGFWQLDRAQEKNQLQAQLEKMRQEKPQAYNDLIELKTFKQVRLAGNYIYPPILLDNRTRAGRVGYEVLNVFRTESGQHVVVNRGWVVAPARRSKLPTIEMPNQSIEFVGSLYFSERAQSPDPESFDTAVRVQSLDFEWLQAKFGVEVPEGWQVRILDKGEPSNLLAEWPDQNYSPQKHYGYAVQWFSLALALTLLSLFATRKIQRQNRFPSENT